MFLTDVHSFLNSAMRVKTAWREHMRYLEPIDSRKFIASASPMIPLIQGAARKLAAIANMNRTVHTPTYNRVFAEAARQYAART